MFGGRQMVDPFNVCGPINIIGILGSGHAELQLRELPCGLDQQFLERRLAVLAVGTKISEIPLFGLIDYRVGFGID